MFTNKSLLAIGLGVLVFASGAYIFQHDFTKELSGLDVLYTYRGLVEKKDPTIVTVYFSKTAHESQILALKSLLENHSSVQSVRYISADQAWEGYKAAHQDNQALLRTMNELGENPLGAILVLKITDSSQRESVINMIDANVESSVIDTINHDEFDRFNRQIK